MFPKAINIFNSEQTANSLREIFDNLNGIEVRGAYSEVVSGIKQKLVSLQNCYAHLAMQEKQEAEAKKKMEEEQAKKACTNGEAKKDQVKDACTNGEAKKECAPEAVDLRAKGKNAAPVAN